MDVRSRLLLVLCLGGASLLATAPAVGQIVYGQQASGGLDIVATHWKLAADQDEVTIDQWAFPASVFIPLRENLEARVFVAQATTTVHQSGQDFDLRGLTDMRLQVSHSFSRDRLLVSAGLNLPTGHTGLSLDEEWLVMNFLSQSFLNFPVRSLGEGFGLNLMAGGATEMGDYRVGASATLDISGAYEAYATEEDYDPGNSLNLTAGMQREFGNRLLNGDITFTTSADDKQGGQPIFSRGDQVALHTGLSGGDKRQRYNGDVTYRIRGRNALFDVDGVLQQQLKIYGNEFIIGGGLDRTTEGDWTYGPAADLHLIAGNEFGLGDSTVLGLGANLGRALTPQINLRLALKYFTGSTQDGDIDLSGYQAWLSASGTF